jgi:hypothetical protein
MEISFFAMPLAGLARAAQGQAYYALTIVSKNGMNPIRILSGQFSPLFRTLQSPLCEGHMAKKDIPMLSDTFHAI